MRKRRPSALRERNRLKTRLLWLLLFSAVLIGVAAMPQLRPVSSFIWFGGACVTSGLMFFAVRDLKHRVSGNEYAESTAGRFYFLIASVALLFGVYFTTARPQDLNILDHPAVSALIVVLPVSFFCSVGAALLWLIQYEKRNGPVYVVRS